MTLIKILQLLTYWGRQLMLRSETRYFSKGSIIADSSEGSKGLMVITSGQVGSLRFTLTSTAISVDQKAWLCSEI